MRQRVMIAMALSCSPKLLIADEPTTALDVTIQAQILDELRKLREETNAGIILVTHDLAVVADIADRVVVMYSGRVVEQGTLDELFYDPQHPYTWGLLGSITRVDRDRGTRLPAIAGMPPSLLAPPTGCHFQPRCPHAFDKCDQVPALESRLADAPDHLDRCWLATEPQARATQRRRPDRACRPGDCMTELMSVEHLKVLFPVKAGLIIDRTVAHVHAVDDVSFALDQGETLGVVGESGCGKTTLIRTLVRLIDSDQRRDQVPRHQHHQGVAQDAAADSARDADGLPGSAGIAQPAQAHPPDPGDAAQTARCAGLRHRTREPQAARPCRPARRST